MLQHPYDPVLLKQARDEIMKPRTCKEFIEFIDNHPNYDLIAEASSRYLRGSPKNDCVWKCVQIDTDWQAINNHIKSYVDSNDIDNNFNTSETTEWRIHDLDNQDTYVPFRHDAEIDNQRRHGFTKHYQLLEVTIGNEFPEVQEIANLFDFVWEKTDINYQPTSGAFPRHVDFLSTMFKRAVEYDPSIANSPYNPITKSPDGWSFKRLLIPTDNWYPGQMFYFEEHAWSNWVAGEGIDFNWQNCRHSTANSGYSPRALIKITGLIRNDHWLANKKFRRFSI